jgi:hypothetical protein
VGESWVRRMPGHPFVPVSSKWGPNRCNRLPGDNSGKVTKYSLRMDREWARGAWFAFFHGPSGSSGSSWQWDARGPQTLT